MTRSLLEMLTSDDRADWRAASERAERDHPHGVDWARSEPYGEWFGIRWPDGTVTKHLLRHGHRIDWSSAMRRRTIIEGRPGEQIRLDAPILIDEPYVEPAPGWLRLIVWAAIAAFGVGFWAALGWAIWVIAR